MTLQVQTTIADRRKQVLDSVLQGTSLREIAVQLGLSHETIRTDYHAIIAELKEDRLTLGKGYVDEHVAMVKARLRVTIAQQAKQYSDKTEANIARYLEQLARLLELPGYTGAQPAPTTALQVNVVYNGVPTEDTPITISSTATRAHAHTHEDTLSLPDDSA